MRRSLRYLAVCGAAAVALAVGAPSQAAGSTALSADNLSGSWSGTASTPIAPNCLTAEVGDTFCSSQTLTTADDGTIDIVVAQAEGDRWDVVVYDADAETETVITVGRGSASFAGVAGEEYLVIVKPFFVTPGNGFTATATLTLPIAEEPPVVEPPAEAPAA